MQAKYLILHNSSHGDIVEEISEHGPNILVPILLLALLIKTIDLRDSSRFVVAPREMDAVRISHLQCDQKRYRFHRVVPSINKIAHKEIVGERHIASDGEKFDEIMQLSMNITTNGNGCFDWGCIGLFREDGSCLFCDEFDLFFSNTFEVFEAVDDHVYFVFIAHLNNNTMISDKEIRSLIWTEVDEENQEADDAGENVLDLSHQ